MGKIIASYLLKVHVHAPDDEDSIGAVEQEVPTNESLKASVIDGLSEAFDAEVTVSHIERTDAD